VTAREPLFCFNIYPFDRLLEMADLLRVMRAGEAAGFDVATFPDHLLPPPESHEALVNRSWWDLPALGAFLAAHTQRVRFYFNVLVLPYHPPIQLAKSLATLDRVSNGRLIVGVGTGWYEDEFARLGLPFAERGAITDEYARAMIELWTAERPRFRGKYVSFENVSFYPKPVQKPHPPLLIGGTGPRPFRRAAEIGAGWVPMQGTLEEIAAQFREIQALARALGREADSLWLGAGIALGEGSEGERAAEHIRGRSAPRVARSADEAIAQIRRLTALGANLISVGMTWADPADYAAQLERFGREVIAPLRRATPSPSPAAPSGR
jgi:probable F420-dependent oxidoreductase